MPCTMTGSPEGDRAWAAEEAARTQAEKVTHLTQLLCFATTILSDLDVFDDPQNGEDEHELWDNLVAWHEAHVEVDRRRKAAELIYKRLKTAQPHEVNEILDFVDPDVGRIVKQMWTETTQKTTKSKKKQS